VPGATGDLKSGLPVNLSKGRRRKPTAKTIKKKMRTFQPAV
jgi:hypothetical protein